MNPELLKLYTALQPLFRERMGMRQTGDDVFDTEDSQAGFVLESIPLKVVLESGVWKTYGYSDKVLIWLPRTIDDSSPEAQARSLIGCLSEKGKRFLSNKYSSVADFLDDDQATIQILGAICFQEDIKC